MIRKIRVLAKKLRYSYLPLLGGKYRYYGTEVHFSPGAFIFDIVADEGIYESELLKQIQMLLRPGSVYFDVGANVGFMSVPILNTHPDVHVVSFEPSPNSLPFLLRTHSGCPYQSKWQVIGKALGESPGTVPFAVSQKNFGGYDGLKFTNRAPGGKQVEVEMTTFDIEWERLGKPDVSVIKMDIEGAEIPALRGAHQLLTTCRPTIVLEWYELNFKCFGVTIADLFDFIKKYRYQIIATPGFFEITTPNHLKMVMATTGNIALVPL